MPLFEMKASLALGSSLACRGKTMEATTLCSETLERYKKTADPSHLQTRIFRTAVAHVEAHEFSGN
jgi:hypothetical protein